MISHPGAHLDRLPIFQGAPRVMRGVTLIELMVAIVVLALLIGIGVPSFRNASLGARMSAVANDLLASIQLARSEAIKRNQTVRLCASEDGENCAAAGGWEQGWVMLDSGGAVLQSNQAAPADLSVRQAGGSATLSFQPIGIGATAATFTVCRASPLGSQERVVTVTATGTAYVTITNNGACS